MILLLPLRLIFIIASGINFSDGLVQNVHVVLTKWKKVLASYLNDTDEQVRLLILSPC